MLKRLKERFIGDARTMGAVADLKSLYDTADDKEAFHAALADGNIDGAAEYHPLSAEELHEKIEGMMTAGEELAEEYPEVVDSDPEEYIDA